MPAQSPSVKRPGQIESSEKIRAFNQTGAAVVEGDMAALNLDFANASYVAIDGGTTDARRNAVAVTTANALRGGVVVAAGPIASGEEGTWIVAGDLVPIKFTSASTRGKFFGATNAQVYATEYADQAALDNLTVAVNVLGVVMETIAATGVAKCRFNGRGMGNLIGGGN